MKPFLIIAFFALLSFLVSQRDTEKGLIFACFLFVISPLQISSQSISFLPTLTIHRGILTGLILSCLVKNKLQFKFRPYNRLFFLFIVTCAISTMFSINPKRSVVSASSIVIEWYLVFFVFLSNIESRNMAKKIFRSIVWAGVVVCFIGFVEGKWGWTPMEFIPESLQGSEIYYFGTVRDAARGSRAFSVFLHPILLGFFASALWPCLLLKIDEANGLLRKYFLWAGVIICGIAVYSSGSRAAFLLSLFNCMFIFFVGSRAIRIRVLFLMFIVLAVLFVNLGVYKFLMRMFTATTDISSVENNPLASSFYYRLQLVPLAFKEITKDGLRLLFGFGPDTFQFLELQAMHGDKIISFRSADNYYVRMFMDFGLVGSIFLISIVFVLLKQVLRLRNQMANPESRIELMGITLFVIDFLLMNSTVNLFRGQLVYIFWIVCALAVSYSRFGRFENMDETDEQRTH